MEILNALVTFANANDISLVLVGGLAVNMHTVPRNTADIDLATTEINLSKIDKFLISLGYKCVYQVPAFSQYLGPVSNSWPIDIMILNEDTFNKLTSTASLVNIGETKILAASAETLIAMKIFALKHNYDNRLAKDLLDIIMLMKSLDLTPTSDKIVSLCKRYDFHELIAKIKELFNAKN